VKAKVKTSVLRFASLVTCLFIVPQLAVAAPGDENWDSNFGVPGANGPVSAIIDVGSRIYFAGSFSSIGGINATNIARWDGIDWSPLGLGVDGSVATVVASGSDLFVGGVFSQAGGNPAANIAKWDGTNWSALSAGINGIVSSLAVMGNDLFAGGNFSSAGGLGVSSIARWDGTNWFNVAGGVNGSVTVLLAKSNSLYVGGSFTQAGTTMAANIARWDGSNWLALAEGLPASPSAIVASASAVYAYYHLYNSYSSRDEFKICRWDGTNWPSGIFGILEAPCFDGCESRAGGMTLNGNDIYIGGLFSWVRDDVPFNKILANSIAEWDETNQRMQFGWVSALGSGLGTFLGGSVALLATGSELFVGGRFGTAGGKPSRNIALWHIPHALSASRSGDNLTLSWPGTGTNFVLEASDRLPPTDWSEIYEAPVLAGNQLLVTNSISDATRFYRLRRR